MWFKHWLAGIRLYIGVATALVAAEVWWWAQLTFGGGNVSVVRAEEAYAWLALVMLVAALTVGPLLKVEPNLPGKPLLRDARRLLGVSAAFFATLHVSISYVVLFHAANPLGLASVYQKAFALGVVALLILLAMAFTSFDRAFMSMAIWWFRLHRLVYVALLFAVLHAFMVGSHASSAIALLFIAWIAAVLLGLHITAAAKRGARPTAWQLMTLVTVAVFTLAIFDYGLNQHFGHNILLHWHDPGHHHG